MTAAAPVLDPLAIRRFTMPELDLHGMWLIPRFLEAFPQHNQRSAIGFLRSIMESNDFCFLSSDTGVALAQVLSSNTLDSKPVVSERFVWVKDREDQAQVKAAADFYEGFHRWAKNLAADIIIVQQSSDVPGELIKQKLGRIFTSQQLFARV